MYHSYRRGGKSCPSIVFSKHWKHQLPEKRETFLMTYVFKDLYLRIISENIYKVFFYWPFWIVFIFVVGVTLY